MVVCSNPEAYRVAEHIDAPIPSLEQADAVPVNKDESTIRGGESGVAGASRPEVDSANFKNDRVATLLLGRAVKRSFDIIVATIGLILFSPILLLCSLALRIGSREPVFCRQLRHGCNREEFAVLTFRSNEITGRAKNNSRMADVDAIVRSSGIDGLPQLINVLRGEMSIVGPRPYIAVPSELLDEHISRTLRWRKLKPGITGWAQVNGCWDESNSIKPTRRRIKHDLYYIEHQSFLLDVKIIMMTLVSKTAYTIADQTTQKRSS
jgi:lipopolysaccharide/colanic/teichoic acid biosynthesis glycosyltransferase